MLQVRIFTNQNKEEKPMSIQIPESNKKQFNELAETIINELAKSFPVGASFSTSRKNFENVKADLLISTLDYLVHSGHLFSNDEGNYHYLTEKTVKNLNSSAKLSALI